MSDLVVHQWSRLGDLIQTAVVLSRWKALKGGRVTLTHDSRYASVVEKMKCVDTNVPIDLQDIVQQTRLSPSEVTATAAIESLLERTKSIRGSTHLVLTGSCSAALFSGMLEPRASLGYTWDKGILKPPAMLEEYLAGIDGTPYPLHICDVWSRMAGMECESFPETFFESGGRNSKSILVFTDAGEARRTPLLDWIADLCRTLIRNSEVQITFVGSGKGEVSDPLSVLKHDIGDRISDLRGRTSLAELMHLCGIHETAIGSDTGGLHLAAACGCQTIGLYFNGASVFNTGPYSENSFVVQYPTWTETEIQSITELLLSQQAKHANPNAANHGEPFWTPFLDDFGICFEHPAWNTESRDMVSKLRQQFTQKWTTDKTRRQCLTNQSLCEATSRNI